MTTITSVASGYWDQAGTWDIGVPTIDNDVVIAHVVTIRDENAVCLSVTVNADKQLVFECSGGATKITFKDDATAKIVNNGTITIQNTTATKKCTWAGGSSANKVDWQTQGTFNPASYWHLEYVRFSFDFTINAKIIYIDKDIWTQNFLVQGANTGFMYVAAGVTWVVGRSDEDGQDRIRLDPGVEMHAIGTQANHITIRGYEATHRMLDIFNYYGFMNFVFVDLDYIHRGIYLFGTTAHNFFDNCSLKGNVNEAFRAEIGAFAYLRKCTLSSTYTWVLASVSALVIAEECTISYTSYDIVIQVGIVVLRSTACVNPIEYDGGQLRYYKKLTLTVKTGNTPIQNAYCTLIQDHAEDYRDKGFEFNHAGYTDANGQAVLWGLWKTDIWKYYTKTTTYYSDETNNGPSGTKEKHLLRAVKEDYWPSQANSYYMSQDRSDTIILTAYTKTVSYGVPELMLLSLIQDNYSILNPPKADVNWLKYPSVFDWDFLLSPKSAGTKTVWVRKEEESHRPITFKARRVDMNLIVTIFLRAKSRLEADVDEARMQKKNMIEEVRDIVIANGPLSAIADFHIRPKHLINKDDTTQDPPVLAHEVHMQCTYLR